MEIIFLDKQLKNTNIYVGLIRTNSPNVKLKNGWKLDQKSIFMNFVFTFYTGQQKYVCKKRINQYTYFWWVFSHQSFFCMTFFMEFVVVHKIRLNGGGLSRKSPSRRTPFQAHYATPEQGFTLLEYTFTPTSILRRFSKISPQTYS